VSVDAGHARSAGVALYAPLPFDSVLIGLEVEFRGDIDGDDYRN
jgi:hypothetical protein